MIVLKVAGFICLTVIGMVFAILSLLLSRSIICDDIRDKRGRHSLRNHPKLKNGAWKWFFLTERIKHMVLYRYVLFIIESIMSTLIVVDIAATIVFGETELLRIALICFLIPNTIAKSIPLFIPWGRYRN